MVEFHKLWRGLKRLILTGADDRALPAGAVTVLGGRDAIRLVGERLGVRGAGSRDRLATATGLTLAGVRATTWVRGLDPALGLAVDQRLGLVAHVALDEAGHAAWLAAVQQGWITLHPQNLQEAVDLTLVAHHLAEQALTPVLVALDAEAIADAVQDVMLPDRALCQRICGAAGDSIPCPTPAQELLFGAERRRLPRAFDLDRPSLHGARGPGLGAASANAFFRSHIAALLDQSLALVGAATGRPLHALHRTAEQATDLVLVGHGAAVELAEQVAASLRRTRRTSIGVLGLRCPMATSREQLAELLRSSQSVIALQPAAALTSPESSIDQLLPDLRGRHVAYYDFPDHPLRAADLLAFCDAVQGGREGDVCLGVEFLPEHSDYPKREILLQALRRDYGDLRKLGLRAAAPLDLRGAGAITIAVARTATVGGEECAPALAALLGGTGDVAVRSRIDRHARGYGATSIDLVTAGARGMGDPGADLPVDLLVLLHGILPPTLRLAAGAAVLLPLSGDDAVDSLPAATLRALRTQGAALYTVGVSHRTALHEAPLPDAVLGAALSVLRQRGRDLDLRRATGARQDALALLPAEVQKARLADFERGFDTVQGVDLDALVLPPAPADDDDIAVPLALRQRGGGEAAIQSVPRFWDQVGVLYRHDQEDALSPDPFMAAGAIPPLTATLHDLSTRRRTIRVFEPQACTGCGDCWVACPDTALGPLALDFDGLLQAGMALCKDDGGHADALRPLVGKVANRARQLIDQQGSGGPAESFLRPSFTAVLDQMAPPDERRRGLQAAFDQVVAAVGGLPVALNQPFDALGQLLTVAVHVEACKACGACTEVCATGAITGETQTADRITAARQNWRAFERLPDTATATLAQLAAHDAVGPAAAMLLDRRGLFTLSGGDPAEPGSGEKIAVHLALAAAEQHLGPRLQRHLETITDLEQQFQARIRELLTAALPADDLTGLEESLAATGSRHVDLAGLLAALQSTGAPAPVDAAWLRALVRTARQLGALRARLADGRSGLGRAPVGLLVAQGNVASWAAAFPYNPFGVPVVLDRVGASAELAEGLCRGQLETLLDDFRLLRRARLELARPVEAEAKAADLAGLTWQQLSPEERDLCPPLLLVGGEDSLGRRGLTELASVLSGDLPIKVLVLADLDFGLQDASGLGREDAGAEVAHGDTGLLALAHRRAFVAQASIGDPDGYVEGCLGALRHDGPALIKVHAPSPRRHGFATHLTLTQARRATTAGALQPFTYDPAAVGLFGLRLTLHDGTEPGQTLADFAVTEGRFARHFAALGDDAPQPTPLAGFLDLDAAQRRGRTPFVEQKDGRLQVSGAMVAACDDRRHALQVLQELAGVVTPFTDRVETAVALRTADQHDHEMAALRQEYEGKLGALRAELQQEFTLRLRDRLVELAERQRQRQRQRQHQRQRQTGSGTGAGT